MCCKIVVQTWARHGGSQGRGAVKLIMSESAQFACIQSSNVSARAHSSAVARAVTAALCTAVFAAPFSVACLNKTSAVIHSDDEPHAPIAALHVNAFASIQAESISVSNFTASVHRAPRWQAEIVAPYATTFGSRVSFSISPNIAKASLHFCDFPQALMAAL